MSLRHVSTLKGHLQGVRQIHFKSLTLLLQYICRTPWRWTFEGWNVSEWHSIKKGVLHEIFILMHGHEQEEDYLSVINLIKYLTAEVCRKRSKSRPARMKQSYRTRSREVGSLSYSADTGLNSGSWHRLYKHKFPWFFSVHPRNFLENIHIRLISLPHNIYLYSV